MAPAPPDAGARPDAWCVVPVYNNAATVAEVVRACRARMANVLVVDDGSTDTDIAALLAGQDVRVERHPRNLGKGCALLTGLAFVAARGARHMVTIDADGQHDPADLPAMLAAAGISADDLWCLPPWGRA